MTTTADILAYLETLAPRHMKMEWDNVGLLCGSPSQSVSKILVALDPFEPVCQEAVELGADLIVTHHPLLFRPVNSVTDANWIGRSIMLLCRNGISAVNAHTNLDCAPEGVNDRLAELLGLSNIEVVAPTGFDEQGHPWGLLRSGVIEEQPLSNFLALVKDRLGSEGLRYADGGKPVHRVAVGGGACGSEFMDAYHAGCDTFVTADVKYNQFWDAQSLGMTIIDAGHFHTEAPIVPVVAKRLAKAFPEVSVVIAKNNRDCMKFF